MRGSDNILDYKTAYKFNRFFFFFLTVKLWFIYFEISSLFCNPKSFFSIFCIFEDFFWKYRFFFLNLSSYFKQDQLAAIL